jgi:DNA-binding transcriptional MerR regulator
MFSSITNVIAIIKALIDLWRHLRDFLEQQRKAEAERKRQELDEAMKDAKNAKTEDEVWQSQDRIVRNKP